MTPLVEIADGLTARLGRLRFGRPVTHVYNPLVYAREMFVEYARRYGGARGRVLLLGMNPGPWGMAQTGVPFGEVGVVRTWLKIEASIGRPGREHPKRPVLGLACTRREVSGARLWGWARAHFGTPRRFFSRFFVANYCPLVFLRSSGANVTPDKLSARERERLFSACDVALRETVEYLRPKCVLGIGNFAQKRSLAALCDMGIAVERILHPSPASPAANRDWSGQVTRTMRGLGLAVPVVGESDGRRGSNPAVRATSRAGVSRM